MSNGKVTKAKHGPPTPAKSGSPTPSHTPALAWVSRGPPLPTERLPNPTSPATELPLQAPTPTPTPTPPTQGEHALQHEAASPLSSPRHEATLPPRTATTPLAPIQTPTGPNPIPVHTPSTRSLPPRAPSPGPSTPSPPQRSIDHTFAPTALLPKTKPEDPWAEYEVLPPRDPWAGYDILPTHPVLLDVVTKDFLETSSRQYADTLKNKQACTRFNSTIKRLMEPETPFLNPYRGMTHDGPHPKIFAPVIIKSFLVREVVAGRTPSPAILDFLSTHFPKVHYTKRTSTLSNAADLREVYNSIFKEEYVMTQLDEVAHVFEPTT
jgi:hypothetical protein